MNENSKTYHNHFKLKIEFQQKSNAASEVLLFNTF